MRMFLVSMCERNRSANAGLSWRRAAISCFWTTTTVVGVNAVARGHPAAPDPPGSPHRRSLRRQHPDDRFFPGFRDHRQLDGAFADVHDAGRGFALREDRRRGGELDDLAGYTGSFEELVAVRHSLPLFDFRHIELVASARAQHYVYHGRLAQLAAHRVSSHLQASRSRLPDTPTASMHLHTRRPCSWTRTRPYRACIHVAARMES